MLQDVPTDREPSSSNTTSHVELVKVSSEPQWSTQLVVPAHPVPVEWLHYYKKVKLNNDLLNLFVSFCSLAHGAIRFSLLKPMTIYTYLLTYHHHQRVCLIIH